MFSAPSSRAIRELSAKALRNLAQRAPEHSARHGRCSSSHLHMQVHVHSHLHMRVHHGHMHKHAAGSPGGPLTDFKAWGFLSC